MGRPQTSKYACPILSLVYTSPGASVEFNKFSTSSHNRPTELNPNPNGPVDWLACRFPFRALDSRVLSLSSSQSQLGSWTGGSLETARRLDRLLLSERDSVDEEAILAFAASKVLSGRIVSPLDIPFGVLRPSTDLDICDREGLEAGVRSTSSSGVSSGFAKSLRNLRSPALGLKLLPIPSPADRELVLVPMESLLRTGGIPEFPSAMEVELPRGLGALGGERVTGIIGIVVNGELDEAGCAHGLGEGCEAVEWT
jgi:hypothetical protein